MKCPYSKEDCLEKECALWMELIIGDPKDGKHEGKCSKTWVPILMIENTQLLKSIVDELKKDK
jgi:hypothetical protein